MNRDVWTINQVWEGSSDPATQLALRCREVLPPIVFHVPAASVAPLAYNSLALCVLDMVWSPGTSWGGVRAVLQRYALWSGLPDPFATPDEAGSEKPWELPPPPAQPLADFIKGVEREGGPEAFAQNVLRNRQRTLSRERTPKAEAAYRVAKALHAHGLETPSDLRQMVEGLPNGTPTPFEQAVCKVPGQANGNGLRTLYRLCHVSERVEPGQTLSRFVAEATGDLLAPTEAYHLLGEATGLLRLESPHLTTAHLDQVIWWYNRTHRTPKPQDTEPPETEEPSTKTTADKEQAEENPFSEPPVPYVSPTVTVPPVIVPETVAVVSLPPTSEASPAPATVPFPVPATSAERANVRISEMPADDRPRERLLQYGADVLSVAELLAILLRTGTGQYSAMGLAQELLKNHGDIRGVASMTIEEMSQVNGIGPAKAAQIKAAIEFGRRLVAASPEERPRIKTPRDVYNQLGPALRDEKREHFVALLLDTKNGVIRQRVISIGDLSSSIVHPREVFKEAVRFSAASLIVAHNHPSGDPTPSPEDVAVTRRLVEAGQLLGIDVLDHVVLGDNRWLSLKEKGLM